MFNRRKFLTKSVLASLAAGLGLTACESAASNNTTTESTSSKQNPRSKAALPVVITTWDNLPAAEKAMATLQAGNSALDAVEEGVKIVEADPKNITVGDWWPARPGWPCYA